MYLTRHQTKNGSCWALNGLFLPIAANLSFILNLPTADLSNTLQVLQTAEDANSPLLAPVDSEQEVWGSGVTYLRSREARKAESTTADVYEKVYDAQRPEIFFKANGWRAVGHGQAVRIRRDTIWNVPEPELTLVINNQGDIVGYTVGNDMSSRDIEGENPLYLPQAKTYNGSCAVGPGIRLVAPESLAHLTIQMEIQRDNGICYQGQTSTNQMKRNFPELAEYLCRELDFPDGVLLMTGTGIVPPDDFTLQSGDQVQINIDGLSLENQVA